MITINLKSSFKSGDAVMAEKKTSNMLVRAIPIDIWERIDRLCRRRNMKRRDFVEQALHFFEETETEYNLIQNESTQSPDAREIKSDFKDPWRGIKRDKGSRRLKQRFDASDQNNRVTTEQIKHETTGKLNLNQPDSGNGGPTFTEKNHRTLTTVYCWGLDH